MDCLFCKIVAGEIPSYKVYEDDFVYSFLDIYPCSEGHTIVLPKKHFDRFTDMGEEDAAILFESVNRIAKVMEKTLGLEGMNIGINNGEIAGQTVQHVHVHIIPRREGDGEGNMHTIVEMHPSTDNIAEIAEKLSSAFRLTAISIYFTITLKKTNYGDLKMADDDQKVLAALKDAGKPLRPGEIAEATGLDSKEVSKILKKLKSEDAVCTPKRCFYSHVDHD